MASYAHEEAYWDQKGGEREVKDMTILITGKVLEGVIPIVCEP